MKKLSNIADYFVICSGTSSIHIKGIADNIVEKLLKKKIRPFRHNIGKDSLWLVIDYVDVVVHVFEEEARDYYKLEQLWGDAKVVKWKETVKKKRKKA